MQAKIRSIRFIFVLIAGFSQHGWCQEDGGQAVSIYDRIWAAPVLYENPDHSGIQSFSLIGRYHGQYWSVNADQGDAADWENRRKIVGFSSKWFQTFTLQAQMYLQTDGGSLYGGLYEAFIKWSPADTNISLSVGRLDYLFTGYERSESSKKINVIERFDVEKETWVTHDNALLRGAFQDQQDASLSNIEPVTDAEAMKLSTQGLTK